MKTEDVIRVNAATNGRMIVGMMFVMHMVWGNTALAFAAILIVCAAWLADAFLSAGKPVWSGAMSIAILISTVALGIATYLSI